MSYPISIDSIPQPTATSPSNNPSNAGVAVAQTNAIVALETKLGTGASTPTSGTVLTGNGTGTSTWGATTGSGNVVLSNSPTLVTPALGTPSSGVATNLTGTASGLTAGNVTTNANLTGPITSSGNATSIASQTGTGSKVVVDTSPTLVTPNLGTPSAAILTNATGLPYAGLLSTIFSGQIQTQTNVGTAAGTMHYINLGGIKFLFGLSASLTAASLTNGSNWTFTFPTSFFTAVLSATATWNNLAGVATQSVNWNTTSASAGTVTQGTTTTPTGNQAFSYIVIGT